MSNEQREQKHNEILASEPSSPFIHGNYAGLDLQACEDIITFEARTGGRVDAKMAQPVVEYYKALARYYQLRYEATKQQERIHHG